jgi:hypothetical protein
MPKGLQTTSFRMLRATLAHLEVLAIAYEPNAVIGVTHYCSAATGAI